jgi:membrane protein
MVTNKKKITGLGPFSFIKDFIRRFSGNRVTVLAASLSFFAIFAIGPISVLISLVLETILRNSNTQQFVLDQAGKYAGTYTTGLITSFFSYFNAAQHSSLITIGSIVLILFTAAGFFSNLKDSLNQIFGGHNKSSIKKAIMKQLGAITIIFGISLILIASIVFNTLVVKVDNTVFRSIHFSSYITSPIYYILSITMTAFMFGIIYHVMPERKIKWKYLVLGSIFASALFTFGRTIFEKHIGSVSYTSIYGAAGSIMILMLWVYYSAIIFYSGAVFARSNEEIANNWKKRFKN